jgi:4-amino-4-deoxy-L-arabinose transferase-like glycosyltransferase
MLTMANDFDGLYGQDAYAYFDYATGPFRERLLALQGPPPFFWPPGYPLLVALASLVVGTSPLAGQVVSLAAAGMTPIWTALLACELWRPSEDARHPSMVPAIAGALVALNGQLWQSSIVVMSDTTGLAAGTLGMWALARYGDRRQARWLILAAAALAYAILTRWAYALVAIPAAVYALWLLIRGRRRAMLVHGAAGLTIAIVVLWPVIAPAVGAARAGLVDPAPFSGNFRACHWDPLNAFRRTLISASGVQRYDLHNGLYYALTPARSFYLTPLLLLLVAPGAWAALRRRSSAAWSLLAWAGVVYLFEVGYPHQNPRFALTHLPPLAILASIGAETMARELGRGRRRALLVWVTAGVIWMTIGGTRLTQRFITRMERSKAMVPWVESRVPGNAQLLTFGLTLTFEHEGELAVHELYVMEMPDITRVLNDDRPTYALLDVANIEAQWKGKPPAENYEWLVDEPGLTVLDSWQGYTLFRVDGD